MSTNLYVRPKPEFPEGKSFYAAKFILAPKYLNHDGSLTTRDKVELTTSDLDFLEGAAAAAHAELEKELREIIELLKEHECIEIWTE